MWVRHLRPVSIGIALAFACDFDGAASERASTPESIVAGMLPTPNDRWGLGVLDGLHELSGVTRDGDDLFLAMNRIWQGPPAQVFRVSPDASGEYSCTGMWSVQRPGEPWVDAEAITTTGRGTYLLLVEATRGDPFARIWEVELPEPAIEPVPEVVVRRWRLPERYADRDGGSEALTIVPPAADVDTGDGAPWVLVGHQAHSYLGLFHLTDAAAESSDPLEPEREIVTDFEDTSGLYYDAGHVFLWHNENDATPQCKDRGATVNVLESYAWDSLSTPTQLRGSAARWHYPQNDDGSCYNLEGIALGPCRDGVRTLFLVNDGAAPHSAHRREIEGFCD